MKRLVGVLVFATAITASTGTAAAVHDVTLSGPPSASAGSSFSVTATTANFSGAEYSSFAGQVQYYNGAPAGNECTGLATSHGYVSFSPTMDGSWPVTIPALGVTGTWYLQAELSPNYRSACIAIEVIAGGGGGGDMNPLPPGGTPPPGGTATKKKCPKGKKLKHGKCKKKKKK